MFYEFPNLSEEGKKEAERLFQSFREKMQAIAKEIIGDMYVELIPCIESDAWSNFRNRVLNGLEGNYQDPMVRSLYEFKAIRAKILEEHRAAIIEDINKDLLEENERLKKELEYERQRARERW